MQSDIVSDRSGLERNRSHVPPTPRQLIPRIALLLALIALCMATHRSGDAGSSHPAAPKAPPAAR